MANARKVHGTNKRSNEQKELDIVICTRYFLQGYTYRQIADKLNIEIKARGNNYTIDFRTVYRDLQKVLIEWKKEHADDMDAYVRKEVQKLDLMECELWQAWEKSKTGKFREKVAKRPSRDELKDSYDTNETTTETSAGNPRFLQLILEVMQRRAKLLGFDAPVKVDVTGLSAREQDTQVPQYNAGDLPNDVLFSLADKLQAGAYTRVMAQKGQPSN